MRQKICFDILCGEKTCASDPGIFCHMLHLSLYGQDTCLLFGSVYDEDGWIQRHKDCIKKGAPNGKEADC